MSRQLKVVICGSREFATPKDDDKVRLRVQARVGKLAKDWKDEDVLVITGGARGVDRWAHQAAIAADLNTHVEEAQWRQGNFYDPMAGKKRNGRMLDMDPDLVIAFWDGWSGGTADTLQKCKERGIEVELHIYEGGHV